MATDREALKKPARKKYLFCGWYTDASFQNRVTSVKGYWKQDLELYAKWRKAALGRGAVKAAGSLRQGQLSVTCRQTPGAKGYQIQAGTARNMKHAKTYRSKGVCRVIKSLTPGHMYYVRVRAYTVDSAGNTVYGPYSKKLALIVR